MARSRKKREAKRRPLTVLHADERWVAIDKPAGIAVHGGAGKTGPSVLDRLEEELGARLHLAHRLDRGTSGVLLLARTAADARVTAQVWPHVEKRYFAVVPGSPAAPRVFDAPLPDPDGRARSARTHLLHALPLPPLNASICMLEITTGRLHQIRRHLAQAGYPVLLDDKHGDFDINKAFVGLAREAGLARPKYPLLMCRSLRAPDASGLPRTLVAPWPRAWPPLLEAGGLQVDALEALA